MRDPLGHVPIPYKLLLTFVVASAVALATGAFLGYQAARLHGATPSTPEEAGGSTSLQFALAGAAIAGAAALILFFPYRFVLRPLARLREASEAIERGDLDVRVFAESEDEIGTLARSMNRMVADLAARTRAIETHERELSEERELLGTIVDHLQDGILFLDRQGRVAISNHATEPVRRASAKGSAGPRICAMASQAITTGKPQATPAAADDGRWYEDAVVPVFGHDGRATGVVWVSRDVTERREIEGRTALAEKLGAVGRLAAGVAHELATPLGSIILYADELAALFADGPRPAELGCLSRYLSTIQAEAYRCRSIVRTLLNFSRRPTQRLIPVDPREVIEEAADLFRHGLKKTSVRIGTPAPAAPGESPARLVVEADPTLLRGALLNILDNAVDALGEDGEIRVTLLAEGDRVAISVVDNGRGIPPEDLPKVMEPFFTTKPPGQGTGLGLSIVDRDVRWMGGEVRIESAVGTGTTVRILLKRVAADAGASRRVPIPAGGPPDAVALGAPEASASAGPRVEPL